jgi:hypothetical protein
MQQSIEQRAKASRLQRLKILVITATAGLGLLLWGAVAGAVASSTTSAANSTAQPVTENRDDDTDFFGSGAQDSAPGLGQANTQPMIISGGS